MISYGRKITGVTVAGELKKKNKKGRKEKEEKRKKRKKEKKGRKEKIIEKKR